MRIWAWMEPSFVNAIFVPSGDQAWLELAPRVECDLRRTRSVGVHSPDVVRVRPRRPRRKRCDDPVRRPVPGSLAVLPPKAPLIVPEAIGGEIRRMFQMMAPMPSCTSCILASLIAASPLPVRRPMRAYPRSLNTVEADHMLRRGSWTRLICCPGSFSPSGRKSSQKRVPSRRTRSVDPSGDQVGTVAGFHAEDIWRRGHRCNLGCYPLLPLAFTCHIGIAAGEGDLGARPGGHPSSSRMKRSSA